MAAGLTPTSPGGRPDKPSLRISALDRLIMCHIGAPSPAAAGGHPAHPIHPQVSIPPSAQRSPSRCRTLNCRCPDRRGPRCPLPPCAEAQRVCVAQCATLHLMKELQRYGRAAGSGFLCDASALIPSGSRHSDCDFKFLIGAMERTELQPCAWPMRVPQAPISSPPCIRGWWRRFQSGATVRCRRKRCCRLAAVRQARLPPLTTRGGRLRSV